MPSQRLLIGGMLCFLLASADGGPAGIAAKGDWPPISDEEKAMTDCPQQPGAPAVYLYREEIEDNDADVFSVYRRMKILTPAGKDYANIEIPFMKGWQHVQELKARVVRANAAPIEFTGQVFEKTVLRAGQREITVKTFALPDVDVGSIIDYRYNIVFDWQGYMDSPAEEIIDSLGLGMDKPEEGGIPERSEILALPAGSWEIQENLFTRRAKFAYTPTRLISMIFGNLMRLNWSFQRMEGATPEMEGVRVELKLENIPAFEKEELMTPEDYERMKVHFFFCHRSIQTPDEYWRKECANWQKGAEKFIGKQEDVAAESQNVIGQANDPQERLKKLYDRAQQIRNLSYEKNLTPKRKKELKIKDNRRVKDVLERNYGLRSDITRTFTALARAAGFEAEVVRVSRRDDKFFQKNLLGLYNQFDSELAVVKLDSRDLLFDPASPFCPMGLIPWSCTETTAIQFSKTPPKFISTPRFPPDMALTQREISLQLDLQGNLDGTVLVSFVGQEALIRRLEYFGSDNTGIKKGLETELSAVLPEGAAVSLQKVDNMANNTPSIQARFEVAIPGMATPAGKRLLLPVSPLLGSRQHPFRHAQRKHPVYFSHPFREFNDIVITLPAEARIENSPVPRQTQLDFASYSLRCRAEDPQKLHIQRDLVIKKNLFPVDQYPAIKGFYDQVKSADEEQVVLSLEIK